MPNQISPRRSSTIDSERAYRRGCHQAAPRLHDLVSARCRTLPEALELLRRAEQALGEYREGASEPGGALLDALEGRLRGEQGRPARSLAEPAASH